MTTKDEGLERLLGNLRDTAPAEIDCEQALEELATYFEAVEAGQLGDALKQVDQHLEVCPCCAQELAALRAALGPGVHPE